MDYIPINMLTLSPPGFMTNREGERREIQKESTGLMMRDIEKGMLIHTKAYLMFNSILLKSNTTAAEHGVCSVNYL